MMKRFKSTLSFFFAVTLLLLTIGCASSEAEKPHVLSGQAPIEEVVSEADVAFRSGDYEAAAILYQIAIGQEPAAHLWYQLGQSNVQLGNGAQALYCFAKAQDMDPEHEGALERLSLYYTSEGDADQAYKYLNQLVAVAPDNWKGHNALGVLADRQRKFAQARRHYTEALKVRPDLAIVWNNLGYSIFLMGDPENAISYMERALELDPSHEPARKNLALVYVEQRQFQKALNTFLVVGDVAHAYTQVGYLAFKTGQHEEAEELLKEAIRQSPTFNKLAHSYLAAVRQAG
jgi:Flp pilus assembly protein TadD